MLSAYADENVPRAIVDGLKRHGMDVVSAQERNQRATDDDILLATATAENRIFLTNDVDLLRIHPRWGAMGRHHCGIVFWRQKLTNGEAIRRILRFASLATSEEAGDTVKFL